MGVRARVEIDDSLTYGDLYQFVDLARASGIDPSAKVIQVPVREHEPDLGVGALELEVASAASFDPRFTFSGEDVEVWFGAIDKVIEQEGDARGVLDELTQLRNRLVGRQAG